ncbi:helicase sen1-like [Nicotiana sylvestris]|uniref:helicase sen1-like n=1 Tax=Nicotiana sylvestris TaxID=4096 RepID=UPI00388CDB82
MKCHHKASIKLICGPPGTGKTRMLSVMLFTLLQMKYRTVTCAPTDVATAQVASKLVKIVRESYKNKFEGFCPLGEILLFGNNNYEDGEDIAEISLNYRVDRLVECFEPTTGWNHCVSSMIDFLEDCSYISLIDFARAPFRSTASSLRKCMLIICTHLPICFIRKENIERMTSVFSLLDSLEGMLFQKNVGSLELCQQAFGVSSSKSFLGDLSLRSFCSRLLVLLKDLQRSLGKLDFLSAMSKGLITDFCIQMASLVFCTASTSYKLHSVDTEPFDLLVVDDANKLKECEAISREAGFGRSLFERLVSFGHANHLLNVQYRMHPSISQFPNSIFYRKQIFDAADVKCKAYEKIYLTGQCFGLYSFINVPWGEEELDNVGYRRNLVEVALVLQIVESLFKAWSASKKKLSIRVISPYASQVLAIQDRLGQKYNNDAHFEVKVSTVDAFQGVLPRRNSAFVLYPWLFVKRCLWILGNEQTLLASNSIWEALVLDAKDRQCFFHADDDTDMRKTILDVVFSDNFRKSFRKLASSCLRKYVLTLLVKLASGWRPKRRNVELVCESSSQVVKQFKVVEGRYVVCTVEIQKEFIYTQVLKVWDLLPLEKVAGFLRRLDRIYLMYTEEFISLCKEKYFEGDLEVPKSWKAHRDIVQYKKDVESKLNRDSTSTLDDIG